MQATYITVGPTQIVVELNLTPGLLSLPEALLQLDFDGDQEIGEAEGRACVDDVLQNVVIQVEGKPLLLSVTKAVIPAYRVIKIGYGTIRVAAVATLSDGMTGAHTIVLQEHQRAYRRNLPSQHLCGKRGVDYAGQAEP